MDQPTLLRSGKDERIYRDIRDAIARGELVAGDRLPPERELGEKFAAGRNTVRRAMHRLEREGRVERHVGRGTFVAPPRNGGADAPPAPPRASPLDILEARAAIEPGWADLAVLRATEDDFERMDACLARMAGAATQQEFREAGYAFHLELARATRNPLIIHIFETVIAARAAAGWGRLRELNASRETQARQTEANRRTLAALRDRDPEEARRRLREHLMTMVMEVTAQRMD